MKESIRHISLNGESQGFWLPLLKLRGQDPGVNQQNHLGEKDNTDFSS